MLPMKTRWQFVRPVIPLINVPRPVEVDEPESMSPSSEQHEETLQTRHKEASQTRHEEKKEGNKEGEKTKQSSKPEWLIDPLELRLEFTHQSAYDSKVRDTSVSFSFG